MCCLSLEKWSWAACKEKDFRLSDARIIAGLGSLSWALITLFLDKCPHFKWWCKQYEGEVLIIIIIHSWARACLGRVRPACQSSAASTKQFGAASSAADLEAMLLILCALPSIPEYTTESFKRQFWRQKVCSCHIPCQCPVCFLLWHSDTSYVSERPVKWDTMALHSWGSEGFYSEGINSAANICFHLAYKHSICMCHCILLPPC